MLRIYTLTTVLLLTAFRLFGQEVNTELKIGEWKDLTTLINIRWVTHDDKKVYAATSTGILTIDKSDFSSDYFSKTNALSDVGAEIIEKNPFKNELIILYKNSNIDLVKEDGVYNIQDILQNRTVSAPKTINHLKFEDESHCLLATAFGLVRLNTDKMIFDFTLFTSFHVLDVLVHDGYYWILGDSQLLRAPVESSNHSNLLIWEDVFETQGIFLTDMTRLEAFNGTIYIGSKDGLFAITPEAGLTMVQSHDGYTVNFLKKDRGELLIGFLCNSFCENILYRMDTSNSLIPIPVECVYSIRNFFLDEQNRYWIGDYYNRLIYNYKNSSECYMMYFNSPPFNIIRDISMKDDVVYFAGQGPTDNFNYNFSSNFFFTLKDGKYEWFNEYNTPDLNPHDNPQDLRDLYIVEPDPNSNKIYFGSYLGGILVKDGDEYHIYDKDNTILEGAIGDSIRTRITGMDFDAKGNLWITNSGTLNPLVVLTKEGKWYSYPLPAQNVNTVLASSTGYLWILSHQSNAGVIVFDPGEDLADPTTKRVKHFVSTNSELETNDVRSIVEDLNGNIWVGTGQGILSFECGGGVFEDWCRGSNRVVVQDDFGDLLIGNEIVKTIAVDGANRKWLGTENGIFVQSQDGFDNISIYTKDNSPLISNNILNLEFKGDDGLLYISTELGLQQLKIDATFAENFFREAEVTVFPNPVHPEYKGTIYIKGLAKDANVKITDMRGRIVHETKALGGLASWDGNDQGGSRAASGVYFVFSSYTPNFDNPTAHVAKFLLLN